MPSEERKAELQSKVTNESLLLINARIAQIEKSQVEIYKITRDLKELVRDNFLAQGHDMSELKAMVREIRAALTPTSFKSEISTQ